jgi:hypothetical protein
MTRMALFGAGASFGSDAPNKTPPLGAGLFDALVKRGGIAATLPPDLQAKFRSNFEIGMQAFYAFSGGNVMRFQRELAHYLAEFLPDSKNAYVKLFRLIRRPTKHLYCTLNYDLLIEYAAVQVGIRGIEYTSTAKPGVLRLLKPHGSSNFWPNMGGVVFQNVQIAGSIRADIQAPIQILSRDETLHRCSTDDSLGPAIAIYAAGKAVKVSPDFVEAQQKMWAVSVSRAATICIVGTKIHLADTHIWNPLTTTRADIHYFGLKSDKDDFEAWRIACGGKKNMHFVEATFAEAAPFVANHLKWS